MKLIFGLILLIVVIVSAIKLFKVHAKTPTTIQEELERDGFKMLCYIVLFYSLFMLLILIC